MKFFTKLFSRTGITDEQILALKYMIIQSDNGSKLAKQILLFLLDHTERLTKPVAIVLTEGDEWGPEEIDLNARTTKSMASCNGTMHLDQLFKCMGSDFHFHSHYGALTADGEFNNDGQFPGWPEDMVSNPNLLVKAPMRYTFWLEEESYYSRDVEIIEVTRAELESVDVISDPLYPDIIKSGKFRGQKVNLEPDQAVA